MPTGKTLTSSIGPCALEQKPNTITATSMRTRRGSSPTRWCGGSLVVGKVRRRSADKGRVKVLAEQRNELTSTEVLVHVSEVWNFGTARFVQDQGRGLPRHVLQKLPVFSLTWLLKFRRLLQEEYPRSTFEDSSHSPALRQASKRSRKTRQAHLFATG